MFGQELVQNMGIIPIPAQDLDDAAVKSEWISLKNYGHATVVINVGDTAGGTFTVTFQEATDNSGTGAQTLSYGKYYATGQRLKIGSVSGKFSEGETITGGTSGLTAYVYAISNDELLVINLTGGTTWTDGETITGGTSGATAVVSGTGQDEDILLDRTCSSTFTVPAVTFKTYVVEIDAEDLTVEDGYDHFRVCLSDPGASTLAGGFIILSGARQKGIPMPSAIGTQKISATNT